MSRKLFGVVKRQEGRVKHTQEVVWCGQTARRPGKTHTGSCLMWSNETNNWVKRVKDYMTLARYVVKSFLAVVFPSIQNDYDHNG